MKRLSAVFLLTLSFVLILGVVLSGCSDSSSDPQVVYVFIGFDKNGDDVTGTAPAGGLYVLGWSVPAPGKGELSWPGKGFAGWNTKPDGTGDWYKPDQQIPALANMVLYAQWADFTRTFHAQSATDDESWYEVEAEELYVGTHCVVYGDILERISPAAAKRVAARYDGWIHDPITNTFGNIYFMSNNGNRVFLLLLDIKDGYAGSGGYVAGYFDSTHMYTTSKFLPNSNEAAMLFLDVNPGVIEKATFYSTIAHELQHLINFSVNVAVNDRDPKDLWIDEGLSSAAEYVYGGGQQDRVDYFNADPMETIAYGNNFFVWNGIWEKVSGDVLADYATVYLFFQWLRIHAQNTSTGGPQGTGIYKGMVSSPSSDYRAVTGQAGAVIDSRFNDWETLLETWMLANAYGSIAPSSGNNRFYGYRGEIETEVHGFQNTGHEYWEYFSPGEGIFSEMAGDFSGGAGTGSHIRYRGLDVERIGIDKTAPYSGGALLTFNANPDIDGDVEGGYLAALRGNRRLSIGGSGNRAAGNGAAGNGAAGQGLPETYPIGFRDRVLGLGNPNLPRAAFPPRGQGR
jgi:hypothetical protein